MMQKKNDPRLEDINLASYENNSIKTTQKCFSMKSQGSEVVSFLVIHCYSKHFKQEVPCIGT